MIMRLRYRKEGGHYHCRLFTAPRQGETFAKCGDLVFNEREWSEVHQQFTKIAEVISNACEEITKAIKYRQQGYTDWLMLSLIGVLFLIIFGGGWFAWQSLKESKVEEARLMAQCLADGKKEYECVALLRKSESSTAVIPMPIFIPSGRVSQ